MRHKPERMLFTIITILFAPAFILIGIFIGAWSEFTGTIELCRMYWKGNIIPRYWCKLKGYGKKYRWDQVDRETDK